MRRLSILTFTLLSLLAFTLPAIAAKHYTDPYKEYDEIDHWDLDLDANIEVPAIPDGERKDVRKYMKNLAADLARRNYAIETTRDAEVVIVTIPTDELFLPNDTVLWTDRANRLLNPLKPLFSDPDLFKIIIAVSTDNTGSEQYCEWLSDARKDSLYDWFNSNADEDIIVIPYGMGAYDPVATNSTRAGRAKNRRLEIYLIPGPKMIELSHEKKLIR